MTQQSLATAFEELYQRLQAGALTDADLIDIETLTWPNYAAFVTRIHGDSALFDTYFGAFKQPYDIFRNFSADDTVLDVGADWGYSAIAMRHQGCRARIVSVEAMAFNIGPLARLKALEGENYDYVHAAAGERHGRLRFYVPVLNGGGISGLSSTGRTLTPYLGQLAASRIEWFPRRPEDDDDQARIAILEVDAAPIDSILETLGRAGERVVAVKMDVEGHEADALKGAARLFKTQKPLLMLEEGDRQPRVVDVMTSYGYFFASRADGRLVPHDGHSPTDDGFWIHPDRVEFYRNSGIFAGAVPGPRVGQEPDAASQQNLVTTFDGLYQRLQAGALADADLIDINTLTWPDVAGFVPRIHADSALFDTSFGPSFKQRYDIFRIFSPDDTVLDVGADWGYRAIAMHHQGCRSRIVSIEAMPFNIPPLATLKGLEGGNYDFVHVAASDRHGRLQFHVPVLNGHGISGLSSTGGTLKPPFGKLAAARLKWFPRRHRDDDDQARIAGLAVDAAPIDSILETLGRAGQRVVAVRLGVEGHEAEALEGAARLFGTQKPLVMVEGKALSPGVAEVMKSHGYFYASRADGRLVPHDGHPPQNHGYWLHPERVDFYRSAGIFAGEVPVPA